jgi:formate dehydrogenase iron-sulfur subunit
MVSILFDVTRCKGCERCVAACVKASGKDPVAAESDRATTPDGLSANRLTTLTSVAPGRFSRLSCMHCVEPSCVAACLVGGLTKSELGPVVYDPDKCIGCRYCMLACPFHVPRYEWDRTAPFMAKCSLCFDRLRDGGQPACVEACPHDVMLFGERKELLRKAHAIIRQKPNGYLPRVWGEHEFGGTSVLFVSDVDLSAAGWPAEGTAPIPSLTDPLIHKTPLIGLSVLLGSWALGAIIQRRNELMGGAEDDGEPAPTSSASRGDDHD